MAPSREGAAPGRRARRRRLALLAALGLAACGDPRPPAGAAAGPATAETAPAATPDRAADDAAVADASSWARDGMGLSPSARPETHELLLESERARRDPSDGGGHAWLERLELPAGETVLRAGGRASFHLVYEAGPLGIAEGGVLFLQSSPFWGWDTPQARVPEAPGFTRVTTSAEGVTLTPEELGPQLLAIRIGGRALRGGEQISLVFGAGDARARVDRYAEREERLWLAVDGDGDGVRQLVADSPRVDVAPGPPAGLVATLPSVARPGAASTARIAWLDARGDAGVSWSGELEVQAPPGLSAPERVTIPPSAEGLAHFEVSALQEGVYRLRLAANVDGRPVEVESNPMVVSASAPRVLWADLHGHSQLSDGTGTPEDYYRYARDAAGLDVAALTDHDHWGMRFLDRSPELWQRIRAAAARHDQPGRFVALVGYEWTSWLHGHRHVLYFEDDTPVWSSLEPATETPAGLWQALAGRRALTFAHHSAGGPVATNWRFRPPPELEPVTEVVSVHGSSEAPDAPAPIYAGVPGNYVRDVLGQGLRLGFIGSGDSHDGHPGLAQLGARSGGLAAIFAEETSRDAVRNALLARRCYASNGPRIWLRGALDGRPMGSVLPPADGDVQRLEIAAAAPEPVARVELVRSGVLLEPVEMAGERDLALDLEIPRLEPGEWLYVRVVQQDGGAAWSSPFWVE